MSELKEYLKLKYMADCKCGKCRLVPDHVLAALDVEIDALRILRPTPIGSGLTPQQANALTFIRSYIETKGHSPSYEEMMAPLKTTSKANVSRMVDRLVERGYLLRGPGRNRSLRLAVFSPLSRAQDSNV